MDKLLEIYKMYRNNLNRLINCKKGIRNSKDLSSQKTSGLNVFTLSNSTKLSITVLCKLFQNPENGKVGSFPSHKQKIHTKRVKIIGPFCLCTQMQNPK